MNEASSLATIALAGLIHASFQLSISTLTLLGSQTLGAKGSTKLVLKLTIGFLFGVFVTSLLLLSSISMWLRIAFQSHPPDIAWAITCGLLIGICVSVWIFYYRRGPGTSLWIPREMARFLVDRSRSTRHTAEAFSLGMSSVIVEIIFIIGPLIAAGLLLIGLSPLYQFIGLVIYSLTALLPLLLVSVHIANGHSLADTQRWRENNKGFLQFMAGLGLIVLSFCLYINQINDGSFIVSGALNG